MSESILTRPHSDITTFLGLTDTPAPGGYVGHALELLRVNAATNAVEFSAYPTATTTFDAVVASDELVKKTL